ncbi:MAG: A24 family peptidase [Gammaproteobacteria bacterium]|nr:A24 family peptidase [Gammaproteobacteria bacterium]
MPLFEPLEQSLFAWLSVAALFGLVTGSFLNVVIHRLPRMMERDWRRECRELAGETAPADGGDEARFDLVQPASHCPRCGHGIAAHDNIPLLSYVWLGGRCRHCRAPISLRYPAIELLTAVLTVVVAWRFGVTWQAAAAIPLTWALIALSFIDLDHKLLPDLITLPLIWAGLVVNLGGLYTDLPSAVVGAVAGYLSLWLVYHLFRLLTGKRGMGYGDFKLLAAFGAWLGWQLLPVVVLLSSLVGAVTGLGMMLLAGHRRGTPIPFGPFLAAAGWTALLWGDSLVRAYLDWAVP